MKKRTETSAASVAPATRFVLTAACVAAMGSVAFTAQAALDPWGPPAAGDVSAYTDQPADPTQALQDLLTKPEANQGSLEVPGGEHLEKLDIGANNVIQRGDQTNFNYPTNGRPSPMFGAQPWTQKMLMFEEFGPEKLDANVQAGTSPFPSPKLGAAPQQDPVSVARSGPESGELDTFLKQAGISPFPQRESNTSAGNPWRPEIELFLERFLNNPPAEGRPPGEGWAHQRWNEFFPQVEFKTVQTGARNNSGLRDTRQLHQYKSGEFGPGGLYYNTADNTNTAFNGTTKGIPIKIHPATCPCRATSRCGPSTARCPRSC